MHTTPVFVDRLIAPTAPRRGWYELALVGSGICALAIGARIAVPLPFSPVPVTAQTLFVLLIGALYGAKRAGVTITSYLAAGAAGAPVFVGGSGPAYFAGPTGGYLLGFLLASVLVGLLAERGWDRRPATAFLAMSLGSAALYLPGLAWLSGFVGAGRVVAAGLLPFLPGALLKILLATALLPLGWRLLGSRKRPTPAS